MATTPNWSQLNQQQKDWVVQQSGYNPSEYQLGDDGYIVSKASQSPAVTSMMGNTDLTVKPSPTPGPQQFSSDSPLKTAAKSFAQAAPSSLATGAGVAGGVAAAPWVAGSLGLAPETGGASLLGLAVPFISGLIASMAARKAQQVIEPKSWQENVALSQAQNPASAFAGNLAAIPLGGFNPSPSTLIRAGGAIPKVLTGLERTLPEQAALRNVAIGGTIGGVGTVAQNVIDTGQLPSVGQFLEGVGTGAVFNQPNVIGRKLGFHPAPTMDPLQVALIQAARKRAMAGTAQPQVNPTVDVAAAMGAPIVEQPSGPIRQVINKPAMARYKGDLFPSEAELARAEGEGMIQTGPAKIYPKADTVVTEAGETVQDLQNQLKEFKKTVGMQQQQPELPQPDSLKDWHDVLTEWAGKVRGVNVSKDGTLVNDAGQPIAGEALLRNELRQAFAKVRPDMAGWDTLPHELFHIFFNDLRTSAKPRDRALVEGFEQKMQQSPEFQKWAADRASQGVSPSQISTEEFITKGQGAEFVKRMIMADKTDTGIRQQFRDIVAHLKTKYTKTATMADYRRLLNYRFTYAKPYAETFGRAGVPANIPSDLRREQGQVGRQQDKPVLPNHESVKMLLDRAVSGTDDASISDVDAAEIHSILLKQVDWSKAPDVYKKLNKPGFDPIDPDDWKDVKKYYDNYISKPVPAVEMREPAPAPSTTPVAPIKENAPATAEEGIAPLMSGGTPKLERTLSKAAEKVEASKSRIADYGKAMPKAAIQNVLKQSFDYEMEQLNKAFKSGDKGKIATHQENLRTIMQRAAEVSERKQQNEPEIPTKLNKLEQDIEEYRRLDEQRNKMIADGSYLLPDKSNYTPEFKSLWQQIEDVKNRHEGLPPASKRYQDNPEMKVATTAKQMEAVRSYFKDNFDKIINEVDEGWQNALGPMVEREGLKSTLGAYVKQNALDNHPMAGDLALNFIKPFVSSVKFARIKDVIETARKSLGYENMPFNEDLAAKMAEDKRNAFYKKQQDIPELRGKPGEGRTPYPFTMKELNKTDKVLSEVNKEAREELWPASPVGPKEKQADELISIDLPEINKLNQESPEIAAFTESPERKQSFAPILTSRIDKIAEKLQSPIADYVTDKLHKFSGEQDYLAGQIGNKLISATKGFDKDQIENVYHYLHEVDDKGSSNIPLSAEEKQLSDQIISILREPRELQNKLGLKVKAGKAYRAGGIKPEGYMFNMLDPQVAYTWAEKPASLEARQYDKAYIDHQIAHGVSPADARQMLNDYKSALGDYRVADPEFGALRKAEGNGLPWELVDKNFATASVRYGNRAARDLAFFKWIQNDPNMLHALQLKDQYGDRPDMSKVTLKEEPINASKEVQDAMRSVFGIDQPRNITAMAAARAVSNLIMGVGTAVRNIANMPAFIANYVQLKQLPLVAKAIQNLNESRTRAFQNNAVKASFQDFDAAGIYQGSPNPLIKLFNRFSELGRKYQGRDLSNRFEGEFYNSLGELLAVDNIARAKTGDREAINWVKRFGDIVEGGPEKLLSEDGQVTQDDINRFAKRFVDAARGTYGPEGLPSWAIEGEFAPFAALSRFSIEKANTIWKDVILPAKKGIYGPLIRYALGSLGSGLLIEKLNELLTGKRGQEPKINEILASGNYEALIPKAISLLQLASFAGTVGDTAQLLSHGMQGKSMTTAQPLSFPLYSFVTDTLGKNIFDASRAIKDGEDPFNTLAQLITSIGTQGIQSYRYLDANVINPEQTKRKERFRDYSIYQELLGQKEPDASINKPNPFEDQSLKQFKRTGNIQEAAQLLPDLLKKAIQDAKGNPERLRKELQKIKENNYQTMPNPFEKRGMPSLSFRSYLMYLQQTQGDDAAAERLRDYLTQNAVNKAKSQMVPTF